MEVILYLLCSLSQRGNLIIAFVTGPEGPVTRLPSIIYILSTFCFTYCYFPCTGRVQRMVAMSPSLLISPQSTLPTRLPVSSRKEAMSLSQRTIAIMNSDPGGDVCVWTLKLIV